MRDILDVVKGAPVSEPLAVIIMSSRSDMQHALAIAGVLRGLDVAAELRVASAHKSVEHLLTMVRQYDATGRRVVYITVSGRTNALSGLVDANTVAPVIACPPYSDRFAGLDVLSSIHIGSAMGPMLVLEPEGAALAAAKVLALGDRDLAQRVAAYHKVSRERIIADDREVRMGAVEAAS